MTRYLGRCTSLLRDPRDPDGGWVVYDSHRSQAVRNIFGRPRVYRTSEKADRRAAVLNRRAR